MTSVVNGKRISIFPDTIQPEHLYNSAYITSLLCYMMATEVDKNQLQVGEEIDCLFCRRSRVLPPPRLSIAGQRRSTGGEKKNMPPKAR